ncbi:hypothetical protein LTR53_014411 [Teratosphaeriaceae sp. CCFEE 6253]|nr:hypothetical protein LTR53_014411 [Teratosphaeriaceae sp. CCFEE 6253]
MPIIRNPFRKQDENVRPSIVTNGVDLKTDSKPVDIPKEKDSTEYKLSEINDSGVYLPPSPTERKSFWSTHSSRSTTSTNYRSLLNASDDQFSISRESFDSYRRSFDISARSPVLQQTYEAGRPPRASLDSRTFHPPPPPRSSNSFTRPSQVPAQTQEEPSQTGFEDVDIADRPVVPQPKKRGLFSRIADYGDHAERPVSQEGNKEKAWHHFGARKRGQSGQGAELGAIPKRETTPKPESQLRKESVHGRHASVGERQTPKSAGKEVPRVETQKPAEPVLEAQATAGAAAAREEELRADSGIDVEHPAEEMKTVSLDDSTPVATKTATPTPTPTVTPSATKVDAGPQAPKPQNPQAPEVKQVES